MQERAKIDLGPSENIYTQGPYTRQRQWKVSSEVKDKRGDTSDTHVTQTTFKQSLMSLFLLRTFFFSPQVAAFKNNNKKNEKKSCCFFIPAQ